MLKPKKRKSDVKGKTAVTQDKKDQIRVEHLNYKVHTVMHYHPLNSELNLGPANIRRDEYSRPDRFCTTIGTRPISS